MDGAHVSVVPSRASHPRTTSDIAAQRSTRLHKTDVPAGRAMDATVPTLDSRDRQTDRPTDLLAAAAAAANPYKVNFEHPAATGLRTHLEGLH